jgi:hypothetical protein
MFDDDGVEILRRFPRLKALDVSGTHITSDALARLANLEALEELAIDGSLITPLGLASLRRAKHLRGLRLNLADPVVEATIVAIMLDDGSPWRVRSDDADDIRRELVALRRARPGIVIGGELPVSNPFGILGGFGFGHGPPPANRHTWPWNP